MIVRGNRQKNRLTFWLVFFDGEETIREWSASGSLDRQPLRRGDSHGRDEFEQSR